MTVFDRFHRIRQICDFVEMRCKQCEAFGFLCQMPNWVEKLLSIFEKDTFLLYSVPVLRNSNLCTLAFIFRSPQVNVHKLEFLKKRTVSNMRKLYSIYVLCNGPSNTTAFVC